MKTFIKHNKTENVDILICEANGLQLLQEAVSKNENRYVKIPEIFKVDKNELHLQFIENILGSKEHYMNLGVGLALIHRKFNDLYGFESDNYIGMNKQINGFSENWGEFFVEKRLGYQIELIKNAKLKEKFENKLSCAKKNLVDFLNNSCKKPSLVHGDLWSGNVLFDNHSVFLIDPAVYYGDREVDIAMTRMFGGFESTFYEYYDKTYPLSKEYVQKEPVYNLYHYLNHYNMFGSMYLNECVEQMNVLKKFYE